MDGIKNSNERTDNTFECLQYERTPNEWLKYSYPANTSLPAFIVNLKARIKYIKVLLDEAKNDKFRINNFWFPGFFDQRNFLTTLI